MTVTSRHQCGPDCICPAHKTPLYYSPTHQAHACQDPKCHYSHGPDLETSADDEAFVTALTTSLVLLVHAWRERAGFVGAHTRTAETYGLCASELEAVLRSAT